LIAAAHRAQADALEIEAAAKRRLADEYDSAQERGEVQKRGGDRVSNVPDRNNAPKAEDIGLTRKDVFEARQLRDAMVADPSIVRRALDDALASGDEPTRAALKRAIAPVARGHAIGTRTASKEERGNNLYETPREAMATLLALEDFSARIWEPACGRGAIARELEDAGHEVLLSDLVDYGTATKDGECQEVGDFLATRLAPDGVRGAWRGALPVATDIVTNPPYGEALNGFVAHALKAHRPKKMALLLNLNFLCGTDDADRNFVLDENPPARILIFSRRLPMMHRDGYEGPRASSQMNTAWFIWEQDADGQYRGAMQARRVDWKEFVDQAALPPTTEPYALTSSRAQAAEAEAAPPPAASVSAIPPLQWRQDGYRHLAYSGDLEVGAAFAPHSAKEKWSWRLFVGDLSATVDRHTVTDLEAAKAGIAGAWMGHLAKAGFAVVLPPEPPATKRRGRSVANTVPASPAAALPPDEGAEAASRYVASASLPPAPGVSAPVEFSVGGMK
ncbi:MAG: hypothetical protein ACK4MX_11465, partial [Thermaurantiacus sp.]